MAGGTCARPQDEPRLRTLGIGSNFSRLHRVTRHDRDRFLQLAHPRGGVMTGETELWAFSLSSYLDQTRETRIGTAPPVRPDRGRPPSKVGGTVLCWAETRFRTTTNSL